MSDLQTFEIGEALDLATVDQILADEDWYIFVAGRRGAFVGDDFDVDAAADRVIEAGGGSSRRHVELAGPQRCDHLWSTLEWNDFGLDALLGEIAFFIGNEENRIAEYAVAANFHDVWSGRQRKARAGKCGDQGAAKECTAFDAVCHLVTSSCRTTLKGVAISVGIICCF